MNMTTNVIEEEAERAKQELNLRVILIRTSWNDFICRVVGMSCVCVCVYGEIANERKDGTQP
jgi:hypothetical protein